jgi:predicted ester cyclase
MSEEQNRRTFMESTQEAYNKGNVDILDEAFTPGYLEHLAGIIPPAVEGMGKSIALLRGAFPAFYMTVEEMATYGDRVWARITARGTHKATFMRFPPTGKPFAITVIDVGRFDNSKVVEHWGVADQLALMAQIGALPRPPRE